MIRFLVFAVYFIVANPRIQMRLLAELREAAFSGDSIDDNEKLASIPILDPIITETLRLVAPWFLPRVVPHGGVQIEEHFIPESTIVVSPSFSQQTSEENFPYQAKV